MPRCHRGVTVFELTVVILIVGLLAAIGTPHFASSVRQRDLRNTAFEVASLVRYIRDAAVNEGRTIRFSVDDHEDVFFSADVEHPQTPGMPLRYCVKQHPKSTFDIQASFDTHLSVAFDYEGMPWANGQRLATGLIRITTEASGYDIRFDSADSQVFVHPTPDHVFDSLAGSSDGELH
ncbi:pilus assembly FimT family protein [Roseiconus lacunae]|uniref:Prepilin-type N-terminal cleavage/methylation domain-containing protein n=1 Tax=Roseiconus lacunae TaxID=2605694 RepID=A0ABT7PLM2_9BACT|nr:hypothetical protein [Roseiconus lacunae]MDM4017390.1 hypothetical protein [Roseiconus lacunae]